MIQLARQLINQIFAKIGDRKLSSDMELYIFDDPGMIKQQRLGWYAFTRVGHVRYAANVDVDNADMLPAEIENFVKEAREVFQQRLASRLEFRERDRAALATAISALEQADKDFQYLHDLDFWDGEGPCPACKGSDKVTEAINELKIAQKVCEHGEDSEEDSEAVRSKAT